MASAYQFGQGMYVFVLRKEVRLSIKHFDISRELTLFSFIRWKEWCFVGGGREVRYREFVDEPN